MFFSRRSFLLVIVSNLFVRAAQCEEPEVACPLRRLPEVGKRGENSPEAVNDEYNFSVLVQPQIQIGSKIWEVECVGTLVTDNIVVTAGHCVQSSLENNAEISAVNVFFLHCYHENRFLCMKRPVEAFINYGQLSRTGETEFDLALLYLPYLGFMQPETLPICNDSESKQASSRELFMLSFSTAEKKKDELLLTRVPLEKVKQSDKVTKSTKWIGLKLRGKGIACSGDSGAPVIIETKARKLCLLAVHGEFIDSWEDDGITKSRRFQAPIVKNDRFMMKLIEDDRKPNSIEQTEWPKKYGLHFREISPPLWKASQQTAPFLPELGEDPKNAGCFSALRHFSKSCK